MGQFSVFPASTIHSGAVFCNTPHSGGWLFCGVEGLSVDSANLAVVRLAAGNWVLQRTATGAETYHVRADLGRALTRLSEAPVLQTLGANPLPPITSQGVSIQDITLIYGVGSTALTSASLTLSQVVYANNTAVAVNGQTLNSVTLPTAVQASPYVVKVPVTNSFFNQTDVSAMVAELTAVLATGTVFTVYGIGFHVNFNYT